MSFNKHWIAQFEHDHTIETRREHAQPVPLDPVHEALITQALRGPPLTL